jgi:hypothetical protein
MERELVELGEEDGKWRGWNWFRIVSNNGHFIFIQVEPSDSATTVLDSWREYLEGMELVLDVIGLASRLEMSFGIRRLEFRLLIPVS